MKWLLKSLLVAAACLLVAAAVVPAEPPASAPSPDTKPAAEPKSAAVPKSAAAEEEEEEPALVNANCCVCHMDFVKEELSRVHLADNVTCIKCHGLSAGHVNDENIGATKPDIVYRRDQVDAMCIKCHETHDAPARDVIARFQERHIAKPPAICTQCHGKHLIDRTVLETKPAKS